MTEDNFSQDFGEFGKAQQSPHPQCLIVQLICMEAQHIEQIKQETCKILSHNYTLSAEIPWVVAFFPLSFLFLGRHKAF